MKHNSNGAVPAKKLLLVSDHNGFSRDLIARWQMQPHLPEFTALSSDLFRHASLDVFDLAVAGDLRSEHAMDVLSQLNRGKGPAIYVTAGGEAVHSLRRDFARITIVPRHDAWLDTLVLVAEEVLKRVETSAHVQRLEQTARANQKHAILGKYMVESRHGFNNALTSVLGNAELLLLEVSSLTPEMREQLETLHAMSLRLHEMMQRFTSLELEMQCAERSSQGAMAVGAVACALGE
ncbi:MAG: hypothetical protein JOZ10_11125 [Acidobacteria bacterium]|nr:hypothetical protein [Acidobacteriota bacterium]MBV9144633.1 hypothetical protein [Acidobacteriota bacterium]MBV9436394.1 hypothetical protein [Acidobacteriota bacterium]